MFETTSTAPSVATSLVFVLVIVFSCAQRSPLINGTSVSISGGINRSHTPDQHRTLTSIGNLTGNEIGARADIGRLVVAGFVHATMNATTQDEFLQKQKQSIGSGADIEDIVHF